MNDNLDKRKTKRLVHRITIRFMVSDSPDKFWDIVSAKDISTGGIGFVYSKSFDLNTELTFKITIPQIEIFCKAAVTRCSPVKKNNPTGIAQSALYDIGVKFIEIDDQSKVSLQNFLVQFDIKTE